MKSEHIVLFDPWPVKSPADSSLMYCKNGSVVQTAWPLRTAGLSHVSPPTLSKDLSLWDTWNTRQAECHHTLQANSEGALACFLWFFDKLCKICALLNNDAVQKPDSQILVVGITSGYSKWRRARWEHQQCRVWSKQEKGHGDGYDQKKRLKVFSFNRPFLEIDLSAAKLFLKGSTLNHS